MRLLWLFVVLVVAVSCVSSQERKSKRIIAGEKSSSTSREKPHSLKTSGNLKRKLASNTPEAQVCVQAICGSAHNNVGMTDLVEFIDRKFFYKAETDLYKRFDKLITAAINQDLQAYQIHQQKTQYLVAHKDSFKLSPEQKRFVAISELLHRWKSGIQTVQERQSEEGYYEPAEYEIGVNEVMAEGIDPKNKVVVKGAEYHGYFALMNSMDLNYFGVPLNHILYNAFPDLSPEEALHEALADCKDGVRVVRERLSLPQSFEGFDYCGSVDKVSELNLNRFQKTYSTMRLWRELSDPAYWPMLDQYVFSPQEDINVFMQSERYKRIADLGARNFSSHPRVNLVKNLCHQAVGQNVETATSSLRKRKINEHIQILKAQLPKLISFQEQMLQEQFLRKVSKINFQLPSTRAAVVEDLTAAFQKVAGAPHNFLGTKISEEEKRKIVLTEFYMSFFQEDLGKLVDGDPEDLLAATGSMCQSYQPQPLHDQIYTSSGSTVLSWSAFLRPAQGIGVIAHELAHGVAQVLWEMGSEQLGPNYGKITERLPHWEKRACVNTYHYTSTDPTRESQYAEEDWADYFAAKILNSAREDLPWAKNFGCLLMQETNSGYRTELENDLYGTHSHPFFRVLHIEATMKGQLPASCQSFAEKPMSCQ